MYLPLAACWKWQLSHLFELLIVLRFSSKPKKIHTPSNHFSYTPKFISSQSSLVDRPSSIPMYIAGF
ncbi:unnamed protein product [Lactuca virosa]|uniref:Uncharacterized protein n=1 Tax=Lactuca virosa TaxID=75947 RepID=A0AAU9LNY9_9ASTR|nr:unnamed protein product [Lactuca virosa]